MNRTSPTPWKPTKAQLLAARNKLVPDLAAIELLGIARLRDLRAAIRDRL